MLNQLLKFTLVSSLLLWLRPRWKSLLALAGAVILVHVLHGEYLNYVELSGNDGFLVWSFALKWFALLAAVAVYIGYLLLGARGGTATRETTSADAPRPLPERAGQDDGFDFLRDKAQLQTRADKVITSKQRSS